MIVTLQTERIRTLEQVRAFVEGNGPAEIKLADSGSAALAGGVCQGTGAEVVDRGQLGEQFVSSPLRLFEVRGMGHGASCGFLCSTQRYRNSALSQAHFTINKSDVLPPKTPAQEGCIVSSSVVRTSLGREIEWMCDPQRIRSTCL